MQLVAAKTLGLAHGLVGVAQQGVGAGVVVRKHGHSDAYGCVHLAVVDGIGRGQLVHEYGQAGFDGRDVRLLAQQQHKFVAAHAGHGIALGDEGAQAPGGFLEQAVAHAVAKGVVHSLEMVQVQHAHGQQQALVAGHEQGVREALGQGGAVVEPGQRVVPGVPGDLVAQVAGFGHIAKHQHAAHGQAVVLADGRSGVFDGVAFARAVDQHLVGGLLQRAGLAVALGGRAGVAAGGLFVQAEHIVQLPTHGLQGGEAGHELRGLVEGVDAPRQVGGDDPVANGGERDFGALLLGLQGLLGALAFGHVHQGADGACQRAAGAGEGRFVVRHVQRRLVGGVEGVDGDHVVLARWRPGPSVRAPGRRARWRRGGRRSGPPAPGRAAARRGWCPHRCRRHCARTRAGAGRRSAAG